MVTSTVFLNEHLLASAVFSATAFKWGIDRENSTYVQIIFETPNSRQVVTFTGDDLGKASAAFRFD